MSKTKIRNRIRSIFLIICILFVSSAAYSQPALAATLISVRDGDMDFENSYSSDNLSVSIISAYNFALEDAVLTSGTVYYTNEPLAGTSGSAVLEEYDGQLGWVYVSDASKGSYVWNGTSDTQTIAWNDFTDAQDVSSDSEYTYEFTKTTTELSLRWSSRAMTDDGEYLDVEITIGAFDFSWAGYTAASVGLDSDGLEGWLELLSSYESGMVSVSSGNLLDKDGYSTFQNGYSWAVCSIGSKSVPVTITFYEAGTDKEYDGSFLFYADDVDQPNWYDIMQDWVYARFLGSTSTYSGSWSGYTKYTSADIWDDTDYQESWYIPDSAIDPSEPYVYLYSDTDLVAAYSELGSKSWMRIYGNIDTDYYGGYENSSNSSGYSSESDYKEATWESSYDSNFKQSFTAVVQTGSTFYYSGSMATSFLFDTSSAYIILKKYAQTDTESKYLGSGISLGLYEVYNTSKTVDYYLITLAADSSSFDGTYAYGYLATTDKDAAYTPSSGEVYSVDYGGTVYYIEQNAVIRVGVPYGSYTVRELVAPSGYEKDSDKTVTVSVSTITENGRTFTVESTDTAQSGSLELKKTGAYSSGSAYNAGSDSSSAYSLEGALFIVTNTSYQYMGAFITLEDGTGYAATTDPDSADENYLSYSVASPYSYDGYAEYYIAEGLSSSLTLPAGTYYIYEFAAPEGYLYTYTSASDSMVLKVTVTKDTVVSAEITNTLKDGYLKLYKNGLAADGTLLVGCSDAAGLDCTESDTYSLAYAMYGVYASEDDADAESGAIGYFIVSSSGYSCVAAAGQADSSYGCVSYNGTDYYMSDSSYMTLGYGTYYIKEVAAPESGQFELSDEIYTVTVDGDSANSGIYTGVLVSDTEKYEVVTLPSTGGPGIYLFIATGLIIFMAGVLAVTPGRRKKPAE